MRLPPQTAGVLRGREDRPARHSDRAGLLPAQQKDKTVGSIDCRKRGNHALCECRDSTSNKLLGATCCKDANKCHWDTLNHLCHCLQ